MSAYQKIQNRIYALNGLAAKARGKDFVLHRPTNPLNPFPSAIGNIKAIFNAQQSVMEKPNKYGNSIWWGVFDGRLTQRFDYLINDENIYFIISQQPNLNIQCIECNYSIKIEQDDVSNRSLIQKKIIMDGWHASILERSKSTSGIDYPKSIGLGEHLIVVPYVQGVEIYTGNSIIDSDGNHYMIKVTEKTDLGWRLWAQKMKR